MKNRPMNRQQRRAQKKATPGYKKPGPEEMIRRICQNGITPEDLEKEFYRGYESGRTDVGPQMSRMCFAAACLALHDLHGFGKHRCAEVLNAMNQYCLTALTSDELIEEVFEKMGLRLTDENEPGDRVLEV